MDKEELEAREKLKLRNIAIEWLGTEHSEGNIQSLVNLILSFTEPKEKQIADLRKQHLDETLASKQIVQEMYKQIQDLQKENAELKVKTGSSIDCEKAKKNGELCLGYGGDEDEPCERCKNCIKCEGGYYQLGETEKDEKIEKMKCCQNCADGKSCENSGLVYVCNKWRLEK